MKSNQGDNASPLRRLRALLGMSQRDLAALAGVAQPAVARAETLKQGVPKRLLALLGDCGFNTQRIVAAHERARRDRPLTGRKE